jgi:prevent-host-death family protein
MQKMYKELYNDSMSKTISISQARANLPAVIKQASAEDVFVTVNGKREAVITNATNYESIIATLEVMNDPETVKRIKQAEKEFKQGKFSDWKDVKKELERNAG